MIKSFKIRCELWALHSHHMLKHFKSFNSIRLFSDLDQHAHHNKTIFREHKCQLISRIFSHILQIDSFAHGYSYTWHDTSSNKRSPCLLWVCWSHHSECKVCSNANTTLSLIIPSWVLVSLEEKLIEISHSCPHCGLFTLFINFACHLFNLNYRWM